MSNAFSLGSMLNGQEAVTAATTAQGTATPLTGGVNVVTTAAGQTGVVLPASYPTKSPVVVTVITATAGLLFPPVGGKINGGTANASVSVAANKAALCFAHENGLDWSVVVGA